MTRTRSDAIAVRPSNNIYTALTGAATIAALIALVVVWIRWTNATGQPLFFGLF